MDHRMVESHGSFAKDYIDAVIAALERGDCKEALEMLAWAAGKIEDMRKEIGFTGA
jgi:hypothetical protein